MLHRRHLSRAAGRLSPLSRGAEGGTVARHCGRTHRQNAGSARGLVSTPSRGSGASGGGCRWRAPERAGTPLGRGRQERGASKQSEAPHWAGPDGGSREGKQNSRNSRFLGCLRVHLRDRPEPCSSRDSGRARWRGRVFSAGAEFDIEMKKGSLCHILKRQSRR